MILSFLFAAGVIGLVAAAAVVDSRTRRIPNWLTVPAAVLGLVFHTLAPTGFGPLASLAGFGIGFALLLLPWLMGGAGMGDVKLLAALGAWLGPKWMLIAFAGSVLVAALLAVAVMLLGLARRGFADTHVRFLGNTGGHSGAATTAAVPIRPRVLPFAVPVAISSAAVVVVLLIGGAV